MPAGAYEIPQNGSFVAEPQYGGYGGHTKWGASYVGAPRYASPMPGAEYSMHGSAPAFSFGYASAPAQGAPSYPQYAMPSAAPYTYGSYEQPIQQSYQMTRNASFTQMPTTASFTYEQPAQPYSYQQQYAAPQSQYAIPQQQSFTAYPQQANYPSMGDMPQFQFFPERGGASLGVDGPSRPVDPMNHTATGPGRSQSPMPGRSQSPMPGRSQSMMNHMQDETSHAKPTGPANHGQAGPGRGNSPMPGRSKSPMNKPNSSTSKRPPTKTKKTKGCCSCGGV